MHSRKFKYQHLIPVFYYNTAIEFKAQIQKSNRYFVTKKPPILNVGLKNSDIQILQIILRFGLLNSINTQLRLKISPRLQVFVTLNVK